MGAPSRGGKAGWAALIVFAVAVNLCLVLAGFAPARKAEVAVLVWPFSAPEAAGRVVEQAGGRSLAGSQLSFVMLARPDAGAAVEDRFIEALYREGALWVFDPGLMTLCGVK